MFNPKVFFVLLFLFFISSMKFNTFNSVLSCYIFVVSNLKKENNIKMSCFVIILKDV